jgi:hypothetical protein
VATVAVRHVEKAIALVVRDGDREIEPGKGPRDSSPRITDLLGAFDLDRLRGTRPPIPASAAAIQNAVVNRIPPRASCSALGVTPDRIAGENVQPIGFYPRTSRLP